METYVMVNFWIGVLVLALNLLAIAIVDYPKSRQETLGHKVFAVLVGGGFTAWAGYLLFMA